MVELYKHAYVIATINFLLTKNLKSSKACISHALIFKLVSGDCIVSVRAMQDVVNLM